MEFISREENNLFLSGFGKSREIRESNLKLLVKSLQSNPQHIKKLELSYNDLQAQLNPYIVHQSRPFNSFISSLIYSYSFFFSTKVQPLPLYISLLPRLTNLTSLYLIGNRLTDSGLSLMSSSLIFLKSLTHLDLSGNNISSKGTTEILKILHKNSSLISLSLCGCKLGDEGFIMFSHYLNQKNHSFFDSSLSLQKFTESYCQSRNKCYFHFKTEILSSMDNDLEKQTKSFSRVIDAQFLPSYSTSKFKGPTIQSLDLSLTGFSSLGFSSLVEGLKQNTSLTSLKIRGSDITKSEIPLLCDLLTFCTHITNLNLCGNLIGKS